MSDENQTTNDGDVIAVESWAKKCQELRIELQTLQPTHFTP